MPTFSIAFTVQIRHESICFELLIALVISSLSVNGWITQNQKYMFLYTFTNQTLAETKKLNFCYSLLFKSSPDEESNSKRTQKSNHLRKRNCLPKRTLLLARCKPPTDFLLAQTTSVVSASSFRCFGTNLFAKSTFNVCPLLAPNSFLVRSNDFHCFRKQFLLLR